jgi:hypothetical protein
MKEKEYLESILPEELNQEYNEAHADHADEPLGLADAIKAKMSDVIGTALKWKIRIINTLGEVVETLDYDSDAMYKLKPGAMMITDDDYKKLQDGKMIHPHQVISVNKPMRTITIGVDQRSTMGMLNKSGNLGPDK